MPTAKTARLGQPLSDREKQIITLIASGHGTAGTATQLGIAPSTLKAHLQRISRKLGTGDRAGIIAAACRGRQVDIEPVYVPSRVPVICQCARCKAQLAAGQGMAARLSRLIVPMPEPQAAHQFGARRS